jgi:hypothetical protein
MKVLIISSLNHDTGSGFAAKKIYDALNVHTSVNATYLTFHIYKKLSFFSMVCYYLAKIYFHICNSLCNYSSKDLFTPFIFNPFIRFDINDYDIINIHWTGFGFLPISLKLSSKPIVITHHDNWWFSGGCHYFYDCSNNDYMCSSCPKNENKNFMSSFFRKRRFLNHPNVSNIFVSENQRSKLNYTGNVIGNIIPFNSVSKNKIYKKYDYLFVASNFVTDSRKGLYFLQKFLNLLDESFNVLIVGDKFTSLKNYRCNITNYLFSNREDLFSFYRLSSIVLVLSYDETFGQVAGESISCGSLPVGFANTGLSDIVNSDDDLLSEFPNIDDLFYKSKSLLYNKSLYEEKLDILQNHIINSYAEKTVSKLYFNIFKNTIYED